MDTCYRRFVAAVAVAIFTISSPKAFANKEEKRDRKPYKAIAGGDVSFGHSDSSYQAEGIKSESVGTDVLAIDTHVLFNLGSVYAGPLVGYQSESGGRGESKYTEDTIDIGGIVDKPFGHFSTDKIVPHAYGGIRYVTSKERGEKSGSSGYRIGVGGGGYYMIRRGIALDPTFEYQYASLTSGEDSKFTKIVTRMGVQFGIVVFL